MNYHDLLTKVCKSSSIDLVGFEMSRTTKALNGPIISSSKLTSPRPYSSAIGSNEMLIGVRGNLTLLGSSIVIVTLKLVALFLLEASNFCTALGFFR